MDLMPVCGQNISYGRSVVTLANALTGGQLSQSGFDAARNRATSPCNGL